MMIIWINSFLIRYFTPKDTGGFTFFPFIILENERLKDDKTFIHHERIHLHQQAEMLLLFFLLIYAAEFLIHLIRFRNVQQAYRHISFEREAYDHETDYNYLKTRKRFAFTKYWTFRSDNAR